MVLTNVNIPKMQRQDALKLHHLSDTAEILLELSRSSSSEAMLHHRVLLNEGGIGSLESSVKEEPKTTIDTPKFLLHISDQNDFKRPETSMALLRPCLGSFDFHRFPSISLPTNVPACFSYDHSRGSLTWHIGVANLPPSLGPSFHYPEINVFEEILKHQLGGYPPPSGWIRAGGGKMCVTVPGQPVPEPKETSIDDRVLPEKNRLGCKQKELLLNTSDFSSKKTCKSENCNSPSYCRAQFCNKHVGGRRCSFENCDKAAQGKTKFCIMHGGGRRCTYPGCEKGARDKLFCAAHGGGRRCSAENCNKLAVPCGKFSKFCVRHGGGRRCATYGCHKSAQSGTSHCVRCGGGRRCQFLGCTKVARGKTDYCMAHTKLFSSRF